MKLKLLLALSLSLICLLPQAQTLYSKSFGSKKNPAILFLHGGPGYNSASFEATTAQVLADEGFYVIVYDRRGEGRSTDANANYNFDQSFEDLLSLYKEYGIKKATLIGHSFGGMVGTKFAKAYPNKVEALVLVGAPVSLQESFKNILDRSRAIYKATNDSVNTYYLGFVSKMDTASLMYSSYCFGHAMQNGFYTPKNPSKEALKIYSKFQSDSILINYASLMTPEGPSGFWASENYTNLDLSDDLRELLTMDIRILGLYGKEDGLYSASQIKDLEILIGVENVQYFDNCSHSVFIDQQRLFIQSIKNLD